MAQNSEPTPQGYNDRFPTWSSDGQQIAFTSDRSGDPEIYVANADGTEPRQLTDTPGRDAHPSWRPDGTILFQSPREGGPVRIFSMNPDGSQQRSLAATTGFCGVPFSSPDGTQIAFQCSDSLKSPGTAEAPWRIYVLAERASSPNAVTFGPGNDQVPSWSPDGRQLLFFSDRSGLNQLYELEVLTRTVRQLTFGPAAHSSASYSPDGTRIAMMRAEPGSKGDAYVLGRDGKLTRITNTGPEFGTPQFSPDGKKLLIQLPTSSGWRVHVAPSDGTEDPVAVEFK